MKSMLVKLQGIISTHKNKLLLVLMKFNLALYVLYEYEYNLECCPY